MPNLGFWGTNRMNSTLDETPLSLVKLPLSPPHSRCASTSQDLTNSVSFAVAHIASSQCIASTEAERIRSSTITKTKNPARIRTKSSKCRSSRRHQLKRGRGSRRRLKTCSCHHVLKGRFDSILCHCTVFQLNYFRNSVRQSESPHRTSPLSLEPITF